MSDDDVVHVDMVETFRMLRADREPDLIILRIETQGPNGKTFNFGLSLKYMAHTARVWAFDLGAIESAIDTGAPLPGKPLGSPEQKAS